MRRLLSEVPPLIGVLILGMLLGSWLGADSGMWWLIVVLGAVAIAAGIAGAVLRGRGTPTTS